MYDGRLIANQWSVKAIDVSVARPFVQANHYARGGSNTAVYCFGLYLDIAPQFLWGITWWLPPTRVAAESVNRDAWQKVLSLSRMAVLPEAPKNACSFMLARAVAHIRRERRFVSLVTYADESQGHTGGVYRASGWGYVGRTGPYERWVDPANGGRQVATQATRTRRRSEMLALGYEPAGKFYKHKFIKHLRSGAGTGTF